LERVDLPNLIECCCNLHPARPLLTAAGSEHQSQFSKLGLFVSEVLNSMADEPHTPATALHVCGSFLSSSCYAAVHATSMS
jgi:hypothetical protein